MLKQVNRLAVVLLVAAMAGCLSPLDQSTEEALRNQVLESHKKYLESVAAAPVIEINRPKSDVERQLEETDALKDLNKIAGPNALEGRVPWYGDDLSSQRLASELDDEIAKTQEKIKKLQGRGNGAGPSDDDKAEIEKLNQRIDALKTQREVTTARSVQLSLQEAVQMSARNNLDVAVARLRPAISAAQLAQAEAVFDAVYFATFDYNKLDTPSPGSVIASFGATRSTEARFSTGIRKSLTTGGSIELATEGGRNFSSPSIRTVEAFDDASLSISLSQPLLRNFGSDVSLAEIQLTRNARASDVETLRETLLDVVLATEQAYWQLVLSRYQVLIQQKLIEATTADRDIIWSRYRLGFDASRAQVSDANAFLARQRIDLIRARQNVRISSDRLKRLINDPNLPITDETLIIPTDSPADAPIRFSLVDAVTTALKQRPELNRALLNINDASIRQRVAENQRLPELNLTGVIRYNGVGESQYDAYDNLDDGDFIDYLIGFEFEQAIGNRAAEAQYRRFQLERQAAVAAYRREAQGVVLEVKESLRNLITAYNVIGSARAARLANEDNVRALRKQMEEGEKNPEFVDLKLRREETLAQSDFAEIQAITEYNSAVANFHRATGALLDHNGIDFNADRR